MKVLDFQVSCPKIFTYRFDENLVFDDIVKINIIFFILIVVFSEFSSDNSTYHSIGIVFFSRLNSLKKMFYFLFSLSNNLVMPSHFRRLCRSYTTGCYQSSILSIKLLLLNFIYLFPQIFWFLISL